jgi:hypothetical protein
MPTLLDDELETHEGSEPRVLTADVQKILALKVRPGSDDAGESVALIAERADVSPRTVYRCLSPDPDKTTINLSLADKLLMACDSHLSHVRLVDSEGYVTGYF